MSNAASCRKVVRCGSGIFIAAWTLEVQVFPFHESMGIKVLLRLIQITSDLF